jgi:hypothetical protein
MKYFLGFVVGSVVVSTITLPFRTKAFKEGYEAQKAKLNQ